LPTHAKLGAATVADAGTAYETTSVVVSALAAVDYALETAVVGQAATCPPGVSFTP
jgi:hypothetical protein